MYSEICHNLRKYPLLRSNIKTGLGQRNSKLIPLMSNCWFLNLYPIMRLPEGRGAGRAMLIEVFVEPEA